jgi:hypothetical protein
VRSRFAAGPPVIALGDLLGLGDQLLLGLLGLGGLLRPLGLAGLALLLDDRPEPSSRAVSEARSPTAFAPSTCCETVFTDSIASSGDITPDRIRCSRSSTSNASASNRSVKKASASSGVPAGYWPTDLSPSAVRTKTFPSSSTRPHSWTDPWLITAAW